MQLIDPKAFDYTAQNLRLFFRERGFLEVSTQHMLSILAACEDPFNIAHFDYAGTNWPMPQTGQMWLEHILLSNPVLPGVYCMSTSFRQEPNPIPGRHDLIFPMFEFETHGDINTLRELEADLLAFLGFGTPPHVLADSTIRKTSCKRFPCVDYVSFAEKYHTKELSFVHEGYIQKEFGSACFLERFPEYTSPFWNMKRVGNTAKKIDVIIHGMETIGSAERSTDPQEMRDRFYSISGGNYAKKLFADFSKDRVESELNEFLSLDFFPRCGGGIGMTRMIRALQREGVVS